MQEDIGYYVKRIMKVFIRFSWGYSLSRMSQKTMLTTKWKLHYIWKNYPVIYSSVYSRKLRVSILNDLILLWVERSREMYISGLNSIKKLNDVIITPESYWHTYSWFNQGIHSLISLIVPYSMMQWCVTSPFKWLIQWLESSIVIPSLLSARRSCLIEAISSLLRSSIGSSSRRIAGCPKRAFAIARRHFSSCEKLR